MRSSGLVAFVFLVLSGSIALGACSSDNAEESAGEGGDSGTMATGRGATDGSATGGSSGANAVGGGSSGGGSGSGGTSGSYGGYDCASPHPAWLFCEDFENMDAGFDAWRAGWAWTGQVGANDPGRMTSSNDAHTGSWSVHYPAAPSAGYQGANLIWRACKGENEPGCSLEKYDKLHFRTYLKLASDHQRVSHFLSVGGTQQYWASGNAGCRPNGERHMGTTVDFKPNTHETFFYTYYPGMTCDSGATCDKYADSASICALCAQKDMPCSNGPECCWGNHFKPATPLALPVGEWVCFEMMMKANDVGQSNGEMAYWIDGTLVHAETTMSWRTTTDLGLNSVNLQHYLTTSAAQNHSNQVWFDDVVVSTEPVGCM